MALAVLTNLTLRMTISWGSIIIILVLQRQNLKHRGAVLLVQASDWGHLVSETSAYPPWSIKVNQCSFNRKQGEEMPAGLFPHTSMDP